MTNRWMHQAAAMAVMTGAACLISGTLFIVSWALDYVPPIIIGDYTATPARPGEVTRINASVKRDISRHCTSVFSRLFVDSTGARFELTEGTQIMNALAIEFYNKISPGKLIMRIKIPEAAAPGLGTVLTPVEYSCNPLHLFHPISALLSINVEVLP